MSGDVTLADTNMYRVFRDRMVELRVAIGDGQPGGTTVTWRGEMVPFDDRAQCWRFGGEGRLVNTIARAVTIVQDLNPQSNHTSVTYELTGGLAPELFPYAIDVRADKGRAHYVITFVFIRAEADREDADD